MAYYDGGGSSWREPPPEDADGNHYTDTYASGNDGNVGANNHAPSYSENGGHSYGTGRASSGGYGAIGDHRSLGGYTNGTSASTNAYHNNHHHPAADNHTTNHHPADHNANNVTIDPLSNPLDEESQVVPSSLDHLSRDELCRMIYRLDYERTAVQERLDAVRSWWRARTERMERKKEREGKEGNDARKGSKVHEGRRRKRARPTSDADATKRRTKGRSAPSGGERVGTEPPSKDEVEATRTRLRDHVTAAVRATVHGGRKVPKSTVRMSDVSLSMARAIMHGYDGSISSETGRMIKWTLNERDMALMLGGERGERLIHPVPHDGTGYLLPHGTDPSSLYGWAKFVGGEVRYDKRDGTVGMTVKTVAVGCGRPETARGLAEYSRWETEELPS